MIAGLAIMVGMSKPIFVVHIASVLALLFAPVIMWLNTLGCGRGLGLASWAWPWRACYVLYMQVVGDA